MVTREALKEALRRARDAPVKPTGFVMSPAMWENFHIAAIIDNISRDEKLRRAFYAGYAARRKEKAATARMAEAFSAYCRQLAKEEWDAAHR